ncbi:hypothetical protein PMAYCL1PPCAC_14536, partial [Pristionchus mayeri]
NLRIDEFQPAQYESTGKPQQTLTAATTVAAHPVVPTTAVPVQLAEIRPQRHQITTAMAVGKTRPVVRSKQPPINNLLLFV